MFTNLYGESAVELVDGSQIEFLGYIGNAYEVTNEAAVIECKQAERLTLWLPRAPNGALKIPCLINPIALRSA